MKLCIDHVVLWVADAARSLAFYEDVLGLAPVRKEEFLAGKVGFPSVRLSDESILDLFPRKAVPMLEAAMASAGGTAGSAGHPLNHVCLATDEASFDAISAKLVARGIHATGVLPNQFGARGLAPRALYFQDPDGNVVEIRHYD